MPLYEYECAQCRKRFELIQKFSDPPETACVACGGRAHRLLSAPALQFKGSGWYITDYARKSPPAGKSDAQAAGEAPAAASSAAEKKPAAATDKESK